MVIAESRIDPENWEDELRRVDGPQLVVAGPGTGKTEFLIRRVAHLIESETARRDEIVVLTFSRRAAADIARRIEKSVGGSTIPIEATTFHSLALRIVEVVHDGVLLSPLTTPEQVSLVRELLRTEEPANWPVAYRDVLTSSAFAEEVADFLMRCSERLLAPPDLLQRTTVRQDWRGIPGFYERYIAEMDRRGRIDYGSLLVAAVGALQTDRGTELAAAYRYVLVDEYQDTSPAQAEIARLLAAPEGNLTVAGDPYQSIYSFRGAELRNVDDFQNSYATVRRIVLNKSFRVPADIMAAALRVVSSGDLPGAAGPVSPAPHSGRVEAYVFDQETAEAEWVAGEVAHAIQLDRVDPSSIAILMRSKREMLNEMSRALTRRKIRHNRPDKRLIDHPAVRLIADLATIATRDISTDQSMLSPGEAAEIDSAARRILLGPLVGASLGKQREMTVARRHSGRWAEIFANHLGADDISTLLADPTWASGEPGWKGFWHVWTTLTAMVDMVTNPERREWRRALASFSQVLDRQADRNPDLSLVEFFDYSEDESFEATPLLSHKSATPAVVLTTLHQAKGLEFETVFIANAVEGVFPDLRRSRRMLRPELLSPERAGDASAQSLFQVQEEMRLAYTAMTRARRRVVWTATEAGVDQGEQRPSRFLVAASKAGTLAAIGRPPESDREPVTIGEMETSLRRIASDPARGLSPRLAAISILASSPKGAWTPGRFAGVAAKGPDSPILGDNPKMSPSQAVGYTRCPRLYAIERRLRIGDPTSVHMQLGSLIHKALEDTELEVIGTGAPHHDGEAAINILRNIWRSSADFGTPEQNKAWLAKAERIVTKLYSTWPPGGAVPVAVEKRVGLEINGVAWYGVIDRLEESPDGLRVIDYKTGAKPLAAEEAATSIQLGFYAMAVNAETGGPNVISAELWFPAVKGKSLTIRSLDIGRLAEVEKAMTEITAQISAENWQPKVSSACTRCAYKSSCPAWPEGRGSFIA